MRRQVRHTHPGQNQKPTLVGNEPDVFPPGLLRPTDEAISWTKVPWRRRPAKTPNGPALGSDDVLEVLTNRLDVAEIVVLLDQGVHQGLFATPPDLTQVDRTNFFQRREQRILTDLDALWSAALHKWVVGCHPLRRQFDEFPAVQLEHQPTAYHVAQVPVGLNPIPHLTELLRQTPSTQVEMLSDQVLDEYYVRRANVTSSVSQHNVHALYV